MSTTGRNIESLLLNLLEDTKLIIPAIDTLSSGDMNSPYGYYVLQVRNHVRRIEFNIKEALDYLQFINGEKQVK